MAKPRKGSNRGKRSKNVSFDLPDGTTIKGTRLGGKGRMMYAHSSGLLGSKRQVLKGVKALNESKLGKEFVNAKHQRKLEASKVATRNWLGGTGLLTAGFLANKSLDNERARDEIKYGNQSNAPQRDPNKDQIQLISDMVSTGDE